MEPRSRAQGTTLLLPPLLWGNKVQFRCGCTASARGLGAANVKKPCSSGESGSVQREACTVSMSAKSPSSASLGEDSSVA
jgi:hypothetical protein